MRIGYQRGRWQCQPFTRKMTRMLEKVREAIERRQLLLGGEHVLVAVSGGADSLALLYALYWLRKEHALKLTIAHLDHGIRADTGEDLKVVRRAAEDLGLPLVYEKQDVPALARGRKLNLEEAARIVRQEFLERAAGEVGAAKIALGHTRTDLAETVLLHLLRGTGPGGLRGLLWESPPYIRPLLSCSRGETRAFCREHAIPFHDDPTNQDTRYLRNAIRLELLPLLSRYNPRAEEALARAAELWAEAEEALNWAARRALEELEAEDGLDLVGLRGLPPGVQALAVRAFLAEKLGGTRRLERVHIEEILRLVGAEKTGEVALPGGIPARVSRNRLIVGRAPARKTVPIPPRELPIPGELELPELGWRLQVVLIPRPESLVPPSPFVAYLDPAKLRPPLFVRTRRPGDRLRPLGMAGEKKVKALLMEAKVPREERDTWPLVCDGAGIVWVVGIRIADEYKVGPETRQVLKLEAERL